MKEIKILGITAVVSTGLSICLLLGILVPIITPPGTPASSTDDEHWSDWGPAGTTIRNAHGWDNWAGSGSASFKSVSDGSGGFYARLTDDDGEGIWPTRSVTSHNMVNSDYVEFEIYALSSPDGGNLNIMLYSGSNPINQFAMGDNEILAYDDDTWRTIYTGPTVGNSLIIRVTRMGDTAWTITWSNDGGVSFSLASTFTNNLGRAYSAYAINKVIINCFIGSAGDYQIRHIDLSWT
jgi:hypothetical protein